MEQVDGAGNPIYLLAFDTQQLVTPASGFTVKDGGTEIYSGGLHGWSYINENLHKTSQISVNYTIDNWALLDDPNLYLYLTGEDHVLTVNGEKFTVEWDDTTETFSVFAEQPDMPEYTIYLGVTSGANVNKGDAVTVGVYVSGDESSISTIQALVKFDVDTLKYTGAVRGNWGDNDYFGAETGINSSDIVTIGVNGANISMSGGGPVLIATLEFEVENAANAALEFKVQQNDLSLGYGSLSEDQYKVTVGDAVSVAAHNITVAFNAGEGVTLPGGNAAAYARYGEVGLYTSDDYDTAFVIPVPTAQDGYELDDPVWSDGAASYTSTQIAAKTFTGSAVFTANAISLNYTIIFIGFGDYKGAPTGYKVALLRPNEDFEIPDGYAFYYDGGLMFLSSKYDAYAWFVDEDMDASAVRKQISLESGEAAAVAYNGDVNRNGRVNNFDAETVVELYKGVWLLDKFTVLSMLTRLEADVNGDKTVDLNDVRAIWIIITD